jgi:pyridoxal phosphate enzyme (YggS family)
MDLRSRYEQVRERIARAAERSGRDPEAITMIAVTKTVTTATVRAAFDVGMEEIGENRVQELVRKEKELRDLPIRWHFIGHLQTNKVRQVLPIAAMIHSVDSSRLAGVIHNLAADRDAVDVLIQINTSEEETKFGIAPAELPELLATMRTLDRLRVRGLMTLGPLTEDPDRSRRSFRRLRECAETLRQSVADAEILSMGMTSDFEIAIEEGATHVRIGTALFGPRA